MTDLSLSQRIELVFDEYKLLFGDSRLGALSDDVAIAQQELEALQKKEHLHEDNSIQDSQLLDPKERLVAYEQFLQTEKIAKKRLQEENLSDLLLEDSSAQSENSNRTKSRLELLAEQRDYKRRRQSYKGGKTGSSKRSYTEVIRDVIETQSEMLRAMNNPDDRTIKSEPRTADF